jgi:hypothetical protein
MQKLASLAFLFLVSTTLATPKGKEVGGAEHDAAYRAWFFSPEQRLKVFL